VQKVFPYELTLSHNTSLTDGQTNKQTNDDNLSQSCQ